MRSSRTETEGDKLRRLVAEYRRAGQTWPASTKDIARWAVQKDKWRPPVQSVEGQLARGLARAMREEMATDDQGRRVRLNHVYPELRVGEDGTLTQELLWSRMGDMNRGQMHGALQLRRAQVLGDCRQMKTDCDSYNDNHNCGKQILLSFDFTEDLAELEEPSTYVG